MTRSMHKLNQIYYWKPPMESCFLVKKNCIRTENKNTFFDTIRIYKSILYVPPFSPPPHRGFNVDGLLIQYLLILNVIVFGKIIFNKFKSSGKSFLKNNLQRTIKPHIKSSQYSTRDYSCHSWTKKKKKKKKEGKLSLCRHDNTIKL